MNPFEASPGSPGLPMTILLTSTPLAAIWNTAEPGKVLEDWVSSPSQVVYSVVPSIGEPQVSVVTRTITGMVALTVVKLEEKSLSVISKG